MKGLVGTLVVVGALGAIGTASSAAPGLSFGPVRGYQAGRFPSAFAISDLNGDGRLDLAVASPLDSTVSVLANVGHGAFARRRSYATGRVTSAVASGDLNGDRRPDVVTANYGANTVSVLLNRTRGRFAAKRDIQAGRGPDAAESSEPLTIII